MCVVKEKGKDAVCVPGLDQLSKYVLLLTGEYQCGIRYFLKLYKNYYHREIQKNMDRRSAPRRSVLGNISKPFPNHDHAPLN